MSQEPLFPPSYQYQPYGYQPSAPPSNPPPVVYQVVQTSNGSSGKMVLTAFVLLATMFLLLGIALIIAFTMIDSECGKDISSGGDTDSSSCENATDLLIVGIVSILLSCLCCCCSCCMAFAVGFGSVA